jgi:hypothetical protein
MGNPKEEETVFQEFLKSAPLFAGVDVKKWCPSRQEPADIECDLVDERKVGVQLTTWLDEQQMYDAKRHEGIELSLLGALEPFPPNETERIFAVWVYAKWRLKNAEGLRARSCSYHGMRLERPARRDVMAGEHHVEMIAAAIEDVKCSRYHA